MKDGNRYATYTLELIRNNGISEEDSKKEGCFFLMFDYFDILYCKELTGERKKYLDYFSIENVFENVSLENPPKAPYNVSYKSLSLYRKADGQPNFFEIQTENGHLSQTPFLALIQISLCKEIYIRKDKKEVDVDGFLTKCEEEILRLADSAILHSGNTKKQIFRSSTTGDFCLIVRTDSVKDIYDIAIKLNGTQNIAANSGHLRMQTYTNVGIECIRLPEGGYATLTDSFVASCENVTIALRFTGDLALRAKLQQYMKPDCIKNINQLQGLFGRYEYLMHISVEDFSRIYPFLCEKKLGINILPSEKNGLAKILDSSCVKNINERILVNILCSEVETIQNNFNGEDERQTKKGITDKNIQLLEKINNLMKWRNYFQEEHCAFQDLFRGMKEIYKAFSPTGMEREAYINWLTFHKDMNILCECIDQMMLYYKAWEETASLSAKKRYRIKVLKNWRVHLQAINQYTKLVQSVNYQTYQSPIYEIQTQIDTEKVMIAYREAMELYISEAFNLQLSEIISPIIYPDISKDKVEIVAPFMATEPLENDYRRQIICTVPSFEYFGRLYDLLPWIIHESSHHLRILTREDRNNFVVSYVFSYVFRKAMEEPLRKLSNHNFYKIPGRLENFLIQCMVQAALQSIKENAGAEFADFNFEKTVFEINNWIDDIFLFGAKYKGKVQIKSQKQLREQAFNFWLDAYRKEDMLDTEALDKILKIRECAAVEEMEDLAEGLLHKYFENLSTQVPMISAEGEVLLEDILCPCDWFEHRLIEHMEKIQKDDHQEAIKDYCYQVIEVFRIMAASVDKTLEDSLDEKLKHYLEKVFELYKSGYEQMISDNDFLVDAAARHIIRNLGLLNPDLKQFQKKMTEIIYSVDNSSLMLHKDRRLRVYKETFADLLMATSLRLNSFGYCRQVLQTVSDANLSESIPEYKNVNYERFRIVTAILLAEENAEAIEMEDINEMQVDGSSLIGKGKEYCRYTIRCIRQKLFQDAKIAADKDKQKEITCFLKCLGRQVEAYLEALEKNVRNMGLLNIMLYGDKNADEAAKAEWEIYKEAAEKCGRYKYNFRRIYCFCEGLENILQQGYVYVSTDIFNHMKEIRQKAKAEGIYGCSWEKNWECLTAPKKDVGEFYNVPEQVYEKTPSQKLENTIEFIQNYYYCSQFRIMQEEAKEMENDEVC